MAHSIIVDLLMKTGSFETDAKRAEKALAKFQQKAVDTGKVVGAAIAGGAIAAAYAFDTLVKSAADFKDMEEMTGATAEDLASLALAAGTAGVEMGTLTANSIRLTKGLTGVGHAGVGNDAEQAAHRQHVLFAGGLAAQHAGDGRLDGPGDLLAFHLDDFLALLDGVTHLLEPAVDLPLLHGKAPLGHGDRVNFRHYLYSLVLCTAAMIFAALGM